MLQLSKFKHSLVEINDEWCRRTFKISRTWSRYFDVKRVDFWIYRIFLERWRVSGCLIRRFWMSNWVWGSFSEVVEILFSFKKHWVQKIIHDDDFFPRNDRWNPSIDELIESQDHSIFLIILRIWIWFFEACFYEDAGF